MLLAEIVTDDIPMASLTTIYVLIYKRMSYIQEFFASLHASIFLLAIGIFVKSSLLATNQLNAVLKSSMEWTPLFPAAILLNWLIIEKFETILSFQTTLVQLQFRMSTRDHNFEICLSDLKSKNIFRIIHEKLFVKHFIDFKTNSGWSVLPWLSFCMNRGTSSSFIINSSVGSNGISCNRIANEVTLHLINYFSLHFYRVTG